MNRERLKRAIGLPRFQDTSAVGIQLDRPDAAVAEHPAGENPSPYSRKEMQFTERAVRQLRP